MRMRPTYAAAVVFAAALAATVGGSGPAEAFFFLPMFQQSQQPSFESRFGRSPSDNTRWKRDRGTDDGAEPTKPSGGTRAKRDEEKSSSGSSGKSGSRRRNPSPAPRRHRAPAAFVRSRLRARAADAPAPRCAGKAPRVEAVRRPPRHRPRPPTPARTPPRRRPVPPAPAAPSAIPLTRSSGRCSRRGSTSSSSSRTSRVHRHGCARPLRAPSIGAMRCGGPRLPRPRGAWHPPRYCACEAARPPTPPRSQRA